MEWKMRSSLTLHGDKKYHNKVIPFRGGKATKQLRIALLFCGGKVVPSRHEVLQKIGNVTTTRGFNSSLFQTLKINEIISFEQGLGYQKGARFKEYMEECLSEMIRLNIRDNPLMKTIASECSNATKFIINS